MPVSRQSCQRATSSADSLSSTARRYARELFVYFFIFWSYVWVRELAGRSHFGGATTTMRVWVVPEAAVVDKAESDASPAPANGRAVLRVAINLLLVVVVVRAFETNANGWPTNHTT